MSVILSFCPIILFYKSLITLAWAGLYVAISNLLAVTSNMYLLLGLRLKGLILRKEQEIPVEIFKREEKRWLNADTVAQKQEFFCIMYLCK